VQIHGIEKKKKMKKSLIQTPQRDIISILQEQ
jgi:hypothetical protein